MEGWEPDPIFVRTMVLNAVIQKKPIEELDKEQCKRYEENAMTFPELEFWYRKFETGSRDVDYDRSKDPKPKHFHDVPVEATQVLLQFMDIEDWLILRRVDRRLQNIVEKSRDRTTRNFKSICLTAARYWAALELDNCQMDYADHANGCLLWSSKKKMEIQNQHYLKLALADLMFILIDPELKLGVLEFKTFMEFVHDESGHKKEVLIVERIITLLQLLKKPVTVGTLIIKNIGMGHLLQMMPFFIPSNVRIEFSDDAEDQSKEVQLNESPNVSIQKLMCMEKWRNMKNIQLQFGAERETVQWMHLMEYFSTIIRINAHDNNRKIFIIGPYLKEILSKVSSVDCFVFYWSDEKSCYEGEWRNRDCLQFISPPQFHDEIERSHAAWTISESSHMLLFLIM